MAQTIDLTPNWQTSFAILTAALENGTDKGKRAAREELQRIGRQLDRAREEQARGEYLASFDYELIADALDVLDPDGSEATNRKQELEAWARSMAATGRGYLPPTAASSSPYSPELAEAFRQGARELQLDRLDIPAGAIVEEAEGGGGAYVRCRVYVSDAERLAMPGEEIAAS